MTDQLELEPNTRSEATKRAWETRRKNANPPLQPAAITEEQARELGRLIESEFQAREEFAAAEQQLRYSKQRREEYIDSLKGVQS